jgi:hypothetical protein
MRHGKQRWLCRQCGVTFVEPVLVRRRIGQRCWFLRWILRGSTVRDLSSLNGHSTRTMRRVIRYWLDRPPVTAQDLSAHRYVMIDSTYLKRRGGAITAVLEATHNTLIAGIFGVHEAQAAMGDFCRHLAERGLTPTAIATDGSPALLRHLRTQWPEAMLQRCLVHIQRQGLSWCRRNPKRPDARALRNLFLRVTRIRTAAQRDRFLTDLADWERRYGTNIDAQPERGYVFSDLKRARSMLWHALPDMFHYLDDPNIPSTTNAVEGYFGRLKKNYRQHPGLRDAQCTGYFQWLFHLLNR